jgi:3D (Asp-Asp-Asp) domain-containing protein
VKLELAFLFCGMLLLCSCDEKHDSISGNAGQTPTQEDLAQGNLLASAASGQPANPNPSLGNGDLSELGASANATQEAFRQRFGLQNVSPEVFARWQGYSARLTAYSEKDLDWPSSTAAADNWEGTTAANGDPLVVPGTTVAVDFSRIPRGSLIYIPALDMYAEANDTGATQQWAHDDAGQSDYGPNGVGRIDVNNFAGDRRSRQVERTFDQWVGNNEYTNIYVVSRGPGWKKGH